METEWKRWAARMRESDMWLSLWKVNRRDWGRYVRIMEQGIKEKRRNWWVGNAERRDQGEKRKKQIGPFKTKSGVAVITAGLCSDVEVSAHLQMQINILVPPRSSVVQLGSFWFADQLIGHCIVMLGCVSLKVDSTFHRRGNYDYFGSPLQSAPLQP